MQLNSFHIANFLFKDKQNYDKLSDNDKNTFFFILNRKIARKFPKHAQLLNNKNIDKSSALDIWYYFFIKNRIIDVPGWFKFKFPTTKKEKSFIDKNTQEFIMEYYNITDKDIDFLIRNYPNELKEEIKKIKKYGK